MRLRSRRMTRERLLFAGGDVAGCAPDYHGSGCDSRHDGNVWDCFGLGKKRDKPVIGAKESDKETGGKANEPTARFVFHTPLRRGSIQETIGNSRLFVHSIILRLKV